MRRGFTLLEVLVSAVLLSIGLVGALVVISQSAQTAARIQDRTRALIFARSKMDEILKEPVIQAGSDQGQGVDQSTPYDWQATIEQSSNDALLLVTVRATNRITNNFVTLSALRRPDIDSAVDTSDTTGTSTTPSSGGTTGTGGGAM